MRQYIPAAPPAQDFVPPAPAETPVLEQDAVSRNSGELLPAGASIPVADSSPTAPTRGAEDADAGDSADQAPGSQLASSAQPSEGGDTSPPWALIGGGLAVGLLGAGLAFAPSRKPSLPPPPPPMHNYPGY